MITRRFLMQAMAAGVPAFGVGGRLLATTRPLRPGLQLYTVLVPLERDFSGTLKTVAKMGYREVETIGTFGRPAAMVRRAFDQAGLVAISQHIATPELYNIFRALMLGKISIQQLTAEYSEKLSVAHLEAIIRDAVASARILGQQYIVWPILFPSQLSSRKLIDEISKAFDRAGHICASEGLTFAFHNHADEFAVQDGVVPYDRVVEQTSPELVKLEMDLFWMYSAGRSPDQYLKRFPGRYKLAHLKDRGKDGTGRSALGQGDLDIAGFLKSAERAGVEHAFVEGDGVADPFEMTKKSYDYLKPLLAR